jgi:hypothetical protein
LSRYTTSAEPHMRSRLRIIRGPLAATWGGWQATQAQPRLQKRLRIILRSNWHHLRFWPCSWALAAAGKSRLATAFCADPTRGAATGAKLWKTSHKAPPATLRPSRNGPPARGGPIRAGLLCTAKARWRAEPVLPRLCRKAPGRPIDPNHRRVRLEHLHRRGLNRQPQ